MMRLVRPLCIFDLEATGANPAEDRIVDVCVVRREPDGSEKIFSSLVNPGIAIPPEATAIHRITDDMVRDAPRFTDLGPRLAEFFAGTDLAGYNAVKFDIPLLTAEFSRIGMEWPGADRRVVDAYVIFSRKEKRDLSAAYKFYCGKQIEGAHRAETDARATAEILWAQIAHYEDLPKDVPALDAWCGQVDPGRVDADGKFIWRNGQAVFGFGNKHRGKPLIDVVRSDRGYIDWMVEKGNFSAEVIRICREALKGNFPVKKA